MARQIYRIGSDIYNKATGQKIGYSDWMANWNGKSDVEESSAPETPAPTPTPTPNTPAVVYGDIGAETPEEKAYRLEQERQGNEAKTASDSVVDEEAIRLATEKRFQAEIDSLNRIYAEKKNAERLKGRGRIGTDTAIQSRRGLIGSTFGESQTNVIEDKNLQAEGAVDDELNFELSQVRAKIRKDASDEVLAKRKAKAEGSDNYLLYLSEQSAKATNKVKNAAKEILARVNKVGGTVDWNNPELIKLAEELKIPISKLKSEYEAEEDAQKSATAEAAFKNRTKLSPGESIYDESGKLLYTAPDKPASNNPKDNIFSDDNGTWQYKNGNWELVDAKDRTTDSDGKYVTIDGKTMWDDGSGNLSDPKLPGGKSTVTPQMVNNASTAIANINEVLKHPGFSDAVGAKSFWQNPLGLFGTDPIAGTEAAGALEKIKSFIGSETLKNMGLIKGVLSDSDMALLKSASTQGLSEDISEKDFINIARKLKAVSWSIINSQNMKPGDIVEFSDSGSNLYSYMNNDGTVYTGVPGDNYQDYTQASEDTGGGDELDSLLDGLNFNKDLSKSGNGSEVKKIASAIGQFESGGNYKSVGPTVTSGMYKGDKAYGKYQIMGKNIASWSKQALGRSISLREFINNPKLQDQIAEYKMAKIHQQYGNVEDVASIWFSGRPVAKAGNAKDVLGTTVPKYIKNVRSIYNRLG